MPFDLNSHFTLDTLYSMEKEGISALTELLQNKMLYATICAPGPEPIYMWPTIYACPSVHEPTLKNLCLLLELIHENRLVGKIRQELKRKSGKIKGMSSCCQ